MNYIAYTFICNPFRPLNEILVAQLSELEFESFEENNPELKAYIPEDLLNDAAVAEVCAELKEIGAISFSKEKIEDRNWNEEWEKSYPVVEIGNRCIIRAPFHPASEKSHDLEIVINPQMSFGTGHHETTYLVMSMLLDLDLTNKSVLDMGSGTGVLAIAAAKRGASKVKAIDNESWAYENTVENVNRNNVDIDVQNADAIPTDSPLYDVTLANINKNVLMKLMGSFSDYLVANGTLILSGFFISDMEEIIEFAGRHDLIPTRDMNRNNWAAIQFEKKEV